VISVFQYPAACGGVTVQFPLPWRERVRVRGYKKVYLLVIPRPLAAGAFIIRGLIISKITYMIQGVKNRAINKKDSGEKDTDRL